MKSVALGFLRNRDAILLYLRDDRPDISYPNYWCPLGGTIEHGETAQCALERELLEEIGCGARGLAFVGTLDMVNDPLCEDHTIHLFAGEIDDRLEDMVLTEGQALRYFTMEEFRTLKFPEALRNFIMANVRAK